MAIALHRVLFVGLLAGTSALAQATKPPAHCAAIADFVEVQGRDTIAFSRLVLTDSTFESATHSVAQGALVRHTGRRTAAGELSQLHLEVWPRIADSAGAPAQIADVAIQGDDVLARVAAPSRGMQMQHDHLPPGGMLYMTGIPLFLELLQRHAPPTVGATTTVQALWLFSGGAVDTVQVTRAAADSVTVGFKVIEYAVKLAPDRSILSALSLPKSAESGSSTRLVRRDCR